MGAHKKIWRSIDPAFYLLLPVLILLIVFMVVPVFRIFLLSFFDPDFTVKHYLKFYNVGIYSQILLRTLTISLMVSICCLIVGYPVAYLMADVPPKTANILLIFVVLPCGPVFWSAPMPGWFYWVERVF